ncbi:rod shape-determining protein MreD [Teredinibacter sp. KSP-S5-2]|uniref:rod shape-determining protein MreD n=1 Tax=Teredinibacter sp. KSP-S5-2 TaxID=3034506 RepID=UPI0029351A30|nr:rod shape-determining protein MreD [Teredinibacter sp. KSP-S5-2]WNO09575.1 rod shape-determining protein MreD [Teredinibacter sp. KSP-S5-2]
MPLHSSQKGLGVFVLLTTLVGLLAAIFPLSSSLKPLRPELLCLLVIYWVIWAPQKVGILYAWLVGLVQDIVEGVVWGGHAMALALVAYVCVVSYQRIRSYSVWHQSLWVFVLVGVHQVVVNWIQGLAGYHSPAQVLLLSILSSAMFWPLLFICLRQLQRLYRVH